MPAGPTIAVFGLGEAGASIAQDLVARDAVVHAYDPASRPTPCGVHRHERPEAATAGADAVLAITAGSDAEAAVHQALPTARDGQLYADLSTSSPACQQRLAGLAASRGLQFCDVALMSTVPGKGAATPQLVAGPGAQAYAALLERLGVAVDIVGDEPGAASRRKLLRSVVTKGLAALLLESLAAARAADLEEWTWQHLEQELTDLDGDVARRLVDGTPRHAERRAHEMRAALAMLDELGVEAPVTAAVLGSLKRLAVPSSKRDDAHETMEDGA